MLSARAFAVITLLILTSCGPSASRKSAELPRNSTGFFKETPKGPVDYIQNDPYVQKRLAEGDSPQQEAPEGSTTPVSTDQGTTAPVTAPTAENTTPTAKSSKAATTPAPVAPKQTASNKPILNEPTPLPSAPGTSLKSRVKGFEISRFAKDEPKKASRFGDTTFQFTVFFYKAEHEVFKGALKSTGGKRFELNETGKRFAVKGTLTDDDNEKTTGVLKLTDLQSKETIEISYRAFKSNLTIRRSADSTVTAGSSLERQLHGLCGNTTDVVNRCQNTFGWVNNWTVLDGSAGGPAFYCVDVLRIVKTQAEKNALTGEPPAFAFCGESLRTGGDTDVYEHKAESLTPDTASDVTLVGNGEEGARMFEATLVDKATNEKNEVLIDVEAEDSVQTASNVQEQPEEVGQLPAEDTGGEDDTVGPQESTTPGTPKQPEIITEDRVDLPPGTEMAPADPTPTQATPAPAKPAAPAAKPSAPVVAADAYMATDMSKPRSARMIRDFNQNRDIPAVRDIIRKYQVQDSGVPNIRNYFIYANPFRKMVKAIARAFDVSPAFGYLTIVESGYFTHGQYTLKVGDSGRAVGAYQMHVPAASEIGLPSGHRQYFAPATCGAARYMANMVNLFWKGDTTVAILAYNQGGGGAKNLMEKSIKYGGKYAYKYSEMQKFSALTKENKKYVNTFLAAYFIASNLSHYKFDPSIPGARTSMPKSGVYPDGSPSSIRDSACRAAVTSI